MQLQATRNTAPELALRRILHGWGFRYLVDRAPLPQMRRRADLVFRGAKVAVFVDGCFWHGCPVHGSRPTKSNAQYWADKIRRNQARDADTDRVLEAAGWLCLRVWEHDDPEGVAVMIADVLRERSPHGPGAKWAGSG